VKVSEAFPSNFLKAEDLGGRAVVCSIESVDIEELGQGRDKERKLIVGFVGKTKRLVCNKTNAGTIAKLYGDDTDGWIGQKITIMPKEVEFQGNMVWAIRVSLQKPGAAPGRVAPKPQPVPEPEPEPADQDGGGVDSDVGF